MSDFIRPLQISRIEVPLDIPTWAAVKENSEMIAEEFNLILKYMDERENLLALTGLSGSRHGGFIMASVVTAVALGIVENVPEKIAANIVTTAKGLSNIARSYVGIETKND
jgi:hypothetical protein